MAFFTPKFTKKLLDLTKIGVGGAVIFCGVALYDNNEKFYKSFVTPTMRLIDPEKAHQLSIFFIKHKIVPYTDSNNSKFLESTVLGVKFPNPIGVAAGYDKNGEAVEGLFRMGFGFVEVGTVTPKPQSGNERPRIFRLPEIGGIINRCGFNGDGYDAVFERLSKLPPPDKRKGALGVNLGKNKESKNAVQDYVIGIRKFGPLADYLVINVSSPNTPGLRNLQQKKELQELTCAVLKERNQLPGHHKPPIFLKISPDLSYEDKKDIVEVILKEKSRVDGLIISNTTVSRPSGADCEHICEGGGLSGQPLKELARSTLKDVAQLTKGRIPIIAVGGIGSGEDAKQRIEDGASLVQIYTSFACEGPPVVKAMAADLEAALRQDSYSCLSDAVGSKLS